MSASATNRIPGRTLTLRADTDEGAPTTGHLGVVSVRSGRRPILAWLILVEARATRISAALRADIGHSYAMSVPSQLTDDQRKVLHVVLESFRANRQWPAYRWLNQIVFVQLGLEFDPLYESMPSGFLLPDPQRKIIAALPPDNPIKLTLRGLVALDEVDAINVFLSALREIGTRAAAFLPPADGQAELHVDSTDVAAALGLTAGDPSLVLARELIVNSVWEIWAGASLAEDGAWSISVIPEKARRYRSIRSIDDVLEMQAPREAERGDWARAVATPDTLLATEAVGSAGETKDVPPEAVFVVYGRNDAARAAMFDFLTALGLEPLTWEKLLATTGEAAPFVGEVLAAGFRVAQAVVVLLTPDDEARLRPSLQGPRDPSYEKELTPQARPNVLFEAGMALVSHRKQTVLVELGQLRPFSDVAGRHTIRMNDSAEQRQALASRLRTAGCPVDLSGNWRQAGNFALALEAAADIGDHEAEPTATHPWFALQADVTALQLDGGPVVLRVENHGPSDQFEATIVSVDGGRNASAPWYVRWRNSGDTQQEILKAHEWVLEVCRDDAMAGLGSSEWTPGWRFLQPSSDVLVIPERFADEGHRYGGPIRATIKVTPRGKPESALRNTLSVSLSERGRAAVWDHWRVES